ncbi:hypothetical protein ACFL4G_05250 [Thermodesulfobacteriota bacterium]
MIENQRPYKRSIKNFLIMRELQMKFALTIILLLLLMMAFFQIQTVTTFKTIDDHGLTEMASKKIFHLQWAFGIGYCVIILFFSIFLSHKIAGPLYRIEKDLKALSKDGDLTRVFRLRKGDEMQEVVQAINTMLVGLRGKIVGARDEREKELGKISRLVDALSSEGGSSEEKTKALEELKAAAVGLNDIDDRFFKV